MKKGRKRKNTERHKPHRRHETESRLIRVKMEDISDKNTRISISLSSTWETKRLLDSLSLYHSIPNSEANRYTIQQKILIERLDTFEERRFRSHDVRREKRSGQGIFSYGNNWFANNRKATWVFVTETRFFTVWMTSEKREWNVRSNDCISSSHCLLFLSSLFVPLNVLSRDKQQKENWNDVHDANDFEPKRTETDLTKDNKHYKTTKPHEFLLPDSAFIMRTSYLL